jgi:DNA-binding MurR/RpiR family transcriptional regulator
MTSPVTASSEGLADRPPLTELIAVTNDELTPSERRLATIIVDDPTALAFETVADLARRAGLSGPTVVRFATKLGFDGYGDLQAYARRSLATQLRRPTDRLRRDDVGGALADDWDDVRMATANSVEAVFDSTTPEQVAAMAEAIATTRGRVWIVSSDTSSAAAHVLHNGLSLLRQGVRHLSGGAAAVTAELVDAAPGDVVVAIDTPRYEQRIVDTVRWLAGLGAIVLAVTDGPLSPLAGLADSWCQVDVRSVGPFDSALPTVAVAELVVADVAARLRDAATRRLDRAEALWALHGVFVDG